MALIIWLAFIFLLACVSIPGYLRVLAIILAVAFSIYILLIKIKNRIQK